MFEFLTTWIKDNIRKEEGQAMAEYGLILALIAVVCIIALGLLGTAIAGKFTAVLNALNPAG